MADGFEHLGWGTDEDEASLIEGVVADRLAATQNLSFSKQVEEITGGVQTALEMVGRRHSRDSARIIAVRAMHKLRDESE